MSAGPASVSWSCTVCTCNNLASATVCAACETPKPGTVPVVAAPLATAGAAAADNDGFYAAGTWNCAECTSINSDGFECEVCLAPRPPPTGSHAAAAAKNGGGLAGVSGSATAMSGDALNSKQPDVKSQANGSNSAAAAASGGGAGRVPIAPTPSDYCVTAILLDATENERIAALEASGAATASASATAPNKSSASAATVAAPIASASDVKSDAKANTKSNKQ